MNKIQVGVGKEIALQSWLRPALTAVGANKDYEQFQAQLDTVEGLLRQSHLESMAMDFAIEGMEGADSRQLLPRKAFALKALRVEVLRMLLGNPSFRRFSCMIASSDLLADFCGVRRLDGIKGVSKSVLERASKFFRPDQVRWMTQVLTEMSGHAERAAEVGLAEPIDTSVCLVDSTCLEANIHFPTDWVLLRDVSTTLLKAVKLIRAAELRQRMPCEPDEFARQMNRLCLQMTHAPRRCDGRKARKQVLRKMKRLLQSIGGHARSHRELLAAEYASTKYSEAQARRILDRIEEKLAQLPKVIKQAHERIIGERQVRDGEKILSVHESDLHVLIRGKAGKQVEFGNTLFLGENVQGYILDWEYYRERSPAEWRQLQESIQRQEQFDVSEALSAVCADKGFSAGEGSKRMQEAGIYDATCPRDPATMKQRFSEPEFAGYQRRRGSTEGRIGIFKQRVGRRLRARGFEHRHLAVAWGVLGHNLWIVARLIVAQQSRDKVPKAA